MRLVWGAVEEVLEDDPAVQRLRVSFPEGIGVASGTALCYPSLTGTCRCGERVLCNTTAVDRGLGTGGEHFVVAREGVGVSLDDPAPGHLMKLRYTPLQRDFTVVEEEASRHHAVMATARHVGRMPVVCCGLHSQVAPVAAAIKARQPGLRVVYVMSDAASLPLAVSRTVPQLLAAGLIDGTVTTGQAFGGAIEAVTLHSGLIAARHVADADVAVVAIGPGIPGTATPFGHGGIAQGEAVNAAAAVGGTPIAVLRLSFADARDRHVPVSHQTLTALRDVALAPARVAVPRLPGPEASRVDEALVAAGIWERHERCLAGTGFLPDCRGVALRSMGRGPEDDSAFFLAAAAAGEVAADRTSGR